MKKRKSKVRKKPGDDWFKVAEMAEVAGLSKSAMAARVEKVINEHPEEVKGKVVLWHNSTYVHPKVFDLVMTLYPVPVVKRPPSGWKRTRELSEELGIPQSTISNWVRVGKVKAVRVGKAFYLNPRSAMRLIELHRASSSNPGQPWLLIFKAAMIYGVAQRTIKRLVRLGKVRALERGRKFYVNEDDLEAQLSQRRSRDEKPPANAIAKTEMMRLLGRDSVDRIVRIAKKKGWHYGEYFTDGAWRVYVDRRVLDEIAIPSLPNDWVPLYEIVPQNKKHTTRSLKRKLQDMGYEVRIFIYKGRKVLATPAWAIKELTGGRVA